MLRRIAAHLRPAAVEVSGGGVNVVRPPPDTSSNVPWVPDAPPLTETGTSVTAEEYAAGAIEPSKLQYLADFFQREGFAIVGGLFPLELLDRIEPRLDDDAGHQMVAKIMEDRGGGGTAGQKMRHLANGLPRQAPWVFPAVVANPCVEQLVAAMLGGAAFMRYYNGNTSLPDERGDELGWGGMHMDGGGWSVSTAEEATAHGIAWPHPPFKLFVNFGTSAMTPGNGSTEMWPGTHLLTETAGKQINLELIELRRASHPPAQVIVPKGGAVFRDLRMWVSDCRYPPSPHPCVQLVVDRMALHAQHRGMPNYSPWPRHSKSCKLCCTRVSRV